MRAMCPALMLNHRKKCLHQKERYAFNGFMGHALQKAKEIAGGAAGLARAITQETGEDISSQAVSQWAEVPPRRVLVVEKITGISRHELRPDIYGPAPQGAVA